MSARESSATPVHDAAERRARGYSWEAFEPGHYVSVKDGHNSPRIVSRLAEVLVAEVLADRPDLDDLASRVLLTHWAESVAIAALIVRRLNNDDVFNGDGDVRTALLKERRAELGRAEKLAETLSLTGRAYAQLVRERAEAERSVVDLDALRARGRAVLDARSSNPNGPDAA